MLFFIVLHNGYILIILFFIMGIYSLYCSSYCLWVYTNYIVLHIVLQNYNEYIPDVPGGHSTIASTHRWGMPASSLQKPPACECPMCHDITQCEWHDSITWVTWLIHIFRSLRRANAPHLPRGLDMVVPDFKLHICYVWKRPPFRLE